MLQNCLAKLVSWFGTINNYEFIVFQNISDLSIIKIKSYIFHLFLDRYVKKSVVIMMFLLIRA